MISSAGTTEATFSIDTVDDSVDEPKGRVIALIRPGNGYGGDGYYSSVWVEDNDGELDPTPTPAPDPETLPVIGMRLVNPAYNEGEDIEFQLTSDRAVESDLMVTVSIDYATSFDTKTGILTDLGGRGYLSDADRANRYVTIPEGQSSVTFSAPTQIVASARTPNGRIEARVGHGVSYRVGDDDRAAVIVRNVPGNEPPTPTPTPTLTPIPEPTPDPEATPTPLPTLTPTPAPPAVPVVGVTAGPDIVEGETATFRVESSVDAPAGGLNVQLTISDGTNHRGLDRIPAMKRDSVRIPAGARSVTYTHRTTDNDAYTWRGSYDVKATVNKGRGYEVGASASATLVASDNDTAKAPAKEARIEGLPSVVTRSSSCSGDWCKKWIRYVIFVNSPSPVDRTFTVNFVNEGECGTSSPNCVTESSRDITLLAMHIAARFSVAVEGAPAGSDSDNRAQRGTVVATIAPGADYTVVNGPARTKMRW